MPGGILDLFGIDTIANRQHRRNKEESAAERQIRLEIQKSQNEGQLSVEKERQKGQAGTASAAAKAAQEQKLLEARIAHFTKLGMSPDAAVKNAEALAAIDTNMAGAGVANSAVNKAQAENRGSKYGVSAAPPGFDPSVQRGEDYSVKMEAQAPGLKVAKDAGVMSGTMPLRPNADNPGFFDAMPTQVPTKIGKSFRVKPDGSFEEVPESETFSTVQPMTAPKPTEIEAAQKRLAAKKMENANSYGALGGLGGTAAGVPAMPPALLAAPDIGVTDEQKKATMISTLLQALKPKGQPGQQLFPGRMGGY